MATLEIFSNLDSRIQLARENADYRPTTVVAGVRQGSKGAFEVAVVHYKKNRGPAKIWPQGPHPARLSFDQSVKHILEDQLGVAPNLILWQQYIGTLPLLTQRDPPKGWTYGKLYSFALVGLPSDVKLRAADSSIDGFDFIPWTPDAVRQAIKDASSGKKQLIWDAFTKGQSMVAQLFGQTAPALQSA